MIPSILAPDIVFFSQKSIIILERCKQDVCNLYLEPKAGDSCATSCTDDEAFLLDMVAIGGIRINTGKLSKDNIDHHHHAYFRSIRSPSLKIYDMSGTETPSLVLPGDDDLNDLYQKVLVGFMPSPITPDCISPVLSDTASEVLPPGQASANRMFFIFVDGNS